MGNARKRGGLGNLESAIERSSRPLADEPALSGALAAGPALLAVERLRFYPDQQPRDMLPDETWAALVASGQNTPAGALAALQAAVDPEQPGGALPRPGSRRVLDHVAELAESIRSEGVLVPLTVVLRDGEHVVLDGHCRAMACVLAAVPDAPVRVETRPASGDEADLADATHRFVLNWTQEKLSPLEAARQLQRIVEIATRVVEAQLAEPASSSSPFADLPPGDDAADWLAAAAAAGAPPSALQRGQTRSHEIEGAARRIVLARTGLSLGQYHVLRQIANLSADAWDLANGLSEAHLRAVVAAPKHLHALLVQLIQAANASVKEARSYCRAAREQGEEFLQQKLDEVLRRREGPLRRRTAVSWEPLLRAVPDDLTPRLSALLAELEALDAERRAVRLRAVARQLPLLDELRRAYAEILDRYGDAQPQMNTDER